MTYMSSDIPVMPSSVKLPASLDLAAADALQNALVMALQEDRLAVLDASAVEMLTTPCIQLILAAAHVHGAAIVNPSAAFVEAFSDLGLNWEDHAANRERSDGGTMTRCILIIDDSRTMRDMLVLTLRDAGYEVLQAADGEEGVHLFNDARVDAVITDINMPRMDGFGVIRHLRGNPANAKLPILVLSTEGDADKRSLARAAGATGWMVKPFDPERLVETVRQVCC